MVQIIGAKPVRDGIRLYLRGEPLIWSGQVIQPLVKYLIPKDGNPEKELKGARIVYIIDHSPIVTELHAGKDIYDIAADQRFKDRNGAWYIDDFGFYVYVFPLLTFDPLVKHEDRINDKTW